MGRGWLWVEMPSNFSTICQPQKLSVICAFVTTNSNSDCLQDHLITHFLVQSSVFCPNSAQQWLFSVLFRFRHILIFDSFPLLTHWQMCRTEGIARSAASTWSGIVGYCGLSCIIVRYRSPQYGIVCCQNKLHAPVIYFCRISSRNVKPEPDSSTKVHWFRFKFKFASRK